jgi:hypothetical protein
VIKEPTSINGATLTSHNILFHSFHYPCGKIGREYDKNLHEGTELVLLQHCLAVLGEICRGRIAFSHFKSKLLAHFMSWRKTPLNVFNKTD